MSDVYGPLTDTFGMVLTTSSDGHGGIVLTSPKFGTVTVTAGNLTNPLIARLVARLVDGEDLDVNWPNLRSILGI